MRLTREDVLHIAQLARMGVSEEDVERFREQLSNILENFEVLQKVDTASVPPTAQSIALQNVMKDDEQRLSMPVGEVVANAPQREGDFFRIKAVLEE